MGDIESIMIIFLYVFLISNDLASSTLSPAPPSQPRGPRPRFARRHKSKTRKSQSPRAKPQRERAYPLRDHSSSISSSIYEPSEPESADESLPQDGLTNRLLSAHLSRGHSSEEGDLDTPIPEIAWVMLREIYRNYRGIANRVKVFGDLPPEVLGRGSFGTVFTGSNPKHCFKCFKEVEDFATESLASTFLLKYHSENGEWPINLCRVGRAQLFIQPIMLHLETYVGYMPMERLDRDLNRIEEYTIPQANQAFKDIGACLCYLSDIGISHTDVKTQNVLLYNKNDVLRMKLGDVACVTKVNGERYWKVRGTAACVSPSMLTNFNYHPEVIKKKQLQEILHYITPGLAPDSCSFLQVEDMWQMGILLLEMVSPSFRKLNNAQTGWWRESVRDIKRGRSMEHALTQAIKHAKCGQHVKDMVHEMLQIIPEERLHFPTFKKHLQRMQIV